jgi:PAS domain S-box-containing protein
MRANPTLSPRLTLRLTGVWLAPFFNRKALRMALHAADAAQDPLDFLASVSDKIDGFLYRCRNDAHYTMLRMTSGFDRMLGRSSAAMVLAGQSFADLIHSEDIQVIRTAIDRALQHDRRWRLVYRLRHQDGHWVWVYETGGGVRGANGELLFLDGVITDVSQFDTCLAAQQHNIAADLD